MKLLFKLLTSFLFCTLTSSCSFFTSLSAKFLLDNYFRIYYEFIDEKQLDEEDCWFTQLRSLITFFMDSTYTMELNFKDGRSYNFYGEYLIEVGEQNHSGEGYLILNEDNWSINDLKVDIVFEASYDIYFDLPLEFLPEGENVTHTLDFRRWDS